MVPRGCQFSQLKCLFYTGWFIMKNYNFYIMNCYEQRYEINLQLELKLNFLNVMSKIIFNFRLL